MRRTPEVEARIQRDVQRRLLVEPLTAAESLRMVLGFAIAIGLLITCWWLS